MKGNIALIGINHIVGDEIIIEHLFDSLRAANHHLARMEPLVSVTRQLKYEIIVQLNGFEEIRYEYSVYKTNSKVNILDQLQDVMTKTIINTDCKCERIKTKLTLSALLSACRWNCKLTVY